MFEELENMVQNFGNVAIKGKREEAKVIEYEGTESQYSNKNTDYQLIAKWDHLESLNSNLVRENEKLKKELDSWIRNSKQLEVELKTAKSNFQNFTLNRWKEG